MNYFEHGSVARRYADSHPYFHPLVINKIKSSLKLREPVPTALDIACGTERSSVALKGIAFQILGTDASSEMLVQAPRDARIRYVKAPAEELPFADESFQLITVTSAFHWFDRACFLSEVHKVLRPSGWLVIYDNVFLGKMRENAEYEQWHHEYYLARYPNPPRNRRSFHRRRRPKPCSLLKKSLSDRLLVQNRPKTSSKHYKTRLFNP